MHTQVLDIKRCFQALKTVEDNLESITENLNLRGMELVANEVRFCVEDLHGARKTLEGGLIDFLNLQINALVKLRHPLFEIEEEESK